MTTTDYVARQLDALTPPADSNVVAAVKDLLGRELTSVFNCMEWAEEEIETACAEHPQHADIIFHGFSLLTPTHDRMANEFVYRSHCRELIDRLLAGEDTRPGTAAEVCCAMHEISLATPLRSAAHGLYIRMWHAAGLPEIPELTKAGTHHEALEGSVIDEHEQSTRRKVAVADRRLRDIDCPGRHHGAAAACAYTRTGQLAIDD